MKITAIPLAILLVACGGGETPAPAGNGGTSDGQAGTAAVAGGGTAGTGSAGGGAANGGGAVNGGTAAGAGDGGLGGMSAGGSQGGHAGAGGSGGQSGGSGGAASGCAHGYKYCEDFEQYSGDVTQGASLGPWKVTVTGMAAASIGASKAGKPGAGTKSLHVTAPAGGANRASLNQKAANGLIPGNNLFGRAMIYYDVAGGADLPIGVHSWIFASSGKTTAATGTVSDAADGAVSMNLGGGGQMLQLNYHWPPPPTEKSVRGGTMTTGAWHCVQWNWDGSGTPPKNQAKVWLDGALAVTSPAAPMAWNFAAPWNTMDFGFNNYQMLTKPIDVYLDDFALDGAMIPCP